ncbi:hypothetical protein DIPPA_12415 [Diplonema papillatum]|nr:hypothetical protein DIPPA_12415 [Diplonema papillatum]
MTALGKPETVTVFVLGGTVTAVVILLLVLMILRRTYWGGLVKKKLKSRTLQQEDRAFTDEIVNHETVLNVARSQVSLVPSPLLRPQTPPTTSRQVSRRISALGSFNNHSGNRSVNVLFPNHKTTTAGSDVGSEEPVSPIPMSPSFAEMPKTPKSPKTPKTPKTPIR